MALAVSLVPLALARRSMSCFVGEPTALRTLQAQRSAGGIVHAKLFAMAVAEIKLGQIAMQVGFADVLIHAVNAAFKDREETFNGVGGDDARRPRTARIRLCCG